MKIILPALCAAVMSLSPFAISKASAAPATSLATTLSVATGQSGASALDDLVQVQQRRYIHGQRGAHRHNQRPRAGHHARRPHPQRPPVHQQRRSSGPDLGSAIVGAIVGGVIVNQLQQPRQYHAPAPVARHGSYLSSNHINWCHNRWRSYRVSDNSYQPYNGPRRVCSSPYGPT